MKQMLYAVVVLMAAGCASSGTPTTAPATVTVTATPAATAAPTAPPRHAPSTAAGPGMHGRPARRDESLRRRHQDRDTCPRYGTLVVTPPNGFQSRTLAVDLPICEATVSSVD